MGLGLNRCDTVIRNKAYYFDHLAIDAHKGSSGGIAMTKFFVSGFPGGTHESKNGTFPKYPSSAL